MNDNIDMLVKKGAKVGNDVFIGIGFYVDDGFEKFLTIEDNAVIAANASVIVHDSAMNNICGLPIRFGKVTIKRNAYIGYGSIIMPGVEIGENSLIGAGSIVTRDIPANMVAYGSPAKIIGTIDDYKIKFSQKNNDSKFYFWTVIPWRDRIKKYSPQDESLLFHQFLSDNRDFIFADAPSALSIGGMESYRFLAYGWYDIENWPPLIRWMGKRAALYLKNVSSSKTLKIRYYNRECNRLAIGISDDPLSSLTLKKDCWDEAIIPLHLKDESAVMNITLEVDRSWIPEEIGYIGDKRALGIALEKIWLE